MNDFLWICRKASFTPCCHILLSGTHPKRRCTNAYICRAAMLL